MVYCSVLNSPVKVKTKINRSLFVIGDACSEQIQAFLSDHKVLDVTSFFEYLICTFAILILLGHREEEFNFQISLTHVQTKVSKCGKCSEL